MATAPTRGRRVLGHLRRKLLRGIARYASPHERTIDGIEVRAHLEVEDARAWFSRVEAAFLRDLVRADVTRPELTRDDDANMPPTRPWKARLSSSCFLLTAGGPH